MFKMLYLLHHCRIRLCLQTSRVAFDTLWIMFLHYVTFGLCRCLYTVYCIQTSPFIKFIYKSKYQI